MTTPFLKRTGIATAELITGNTPPITVIGNEAICNTFELDTIAQAVNARRCPGVTDLVLNSDAHVGYGAPIGCVLLSPSHIYPGPVGVDVKCSMSLLQFDVPTADLADKRLRRAIINAIEQRITTGFASSKSLKKAPKFTDEQARQAIIEGASESVCEQLGIPFEWTQRCEDSRHFAEDGTTETLEKRFDELVASGLFRDLPRQLRQLGTYGGGNHFGECEDVQLCEEDSDSEQTARIAEVFGLRHGCAAFLSHCGSRGFGNIIARNQFKILQEKFETWGIPFPAGDKELVYAPVGTPEATNYLNDMALGGNFATVNHLLINALIKDAFEEILPGVKANLVYYISHNFIRRETQGKDNSMTYVHRKGATRALPAGHWQLKDTPFYETGHPILLPGNPSSGSAVMVALPGAELSRYSINHGAGRAMGRRDAQRQLDQKTVNDQFNAEDILTNCRNYPLDEAPKAYKDFNAVLESVKQAGLAKEIARLHARFVIKDADKADD